VADSTSQHLIEAALKPTGAPETVAAVEAVNASVVRLNHTSDAAQSEALQLAQAERTAVAAIGQVTAAARAETTQLAAATRQTDAAEGETRDLTAALKQEAASAAVATAATARLQDEMAETIPVADRLGEELKEVVGGTFIARVRQVLPEVRKLHEAMEEFGEGVQDFGDKWSTRVSLPLAAVAAAGTAAAVPFNDSITRLVTLGGVAKEEAESWRGDLLEIAKLTAQMPADLGAAALVAASSGQRGAEALATVRDAAKGAALGLGEVNTVTRVGTAAATAYAAEGLKAGRAIEIVLATGRAGNFAVDQFAGSVGDVLPLAAALGVEFEEVGGYVAAMTRVNGDAAKSVTMLRGYLQTLLQPSSEAEDVLKAMGLATRGTAITVDELRRKVADEGLVDTLLELIDLFRGNDEALAMVIPGVEGLVGVLGTAGIQGEEFRTVAQGVVDSVGLLDDSFRTVAETPEHAMRQAVQEVTVLATALGTELVPAIGQVLEAGKPIAVFIGDAIDGFSRLPGPLKTTAIAIGAITIAAGPMISGVGAAIKAVVALRIATNTALTVHGIAALPAALTATGAAGATAAAGTQAAAVGMTAAATAGRSLAIVLGGAGALALGISAVIFLLGRMGRGAREAGEAAKQMAADSQRALSEFQAAVAGMSRATADEALSYRVDLEGTQRAEITQEEARVAQLEAELRATRESVERQRTAAGGRHANFSALDAEIKAGEAKLADANTRLSTLRAAYDKNLSEMDELRARLNGFVREDSGLTEDGTAWVPPKLNLGGDGDKVIPSQVGLPGTSFDAVSGSSQALQMLLARTIELRGSAAEMRLEIAAAGETLAALPAGSDAWKDKNEEVYRLRREYQQLNTELSATLVALQAIAAERGVPLNPDGTLPLMAAPPSLTSQPDWAELARPFDARAARLSRVAEVERQRSELAVAAAAGVQWDQLAPDSQGWAQSREAYQAMVEAAGHGAKDLDAARIAMVQSIGGLATAIVDGSLVMEDGTLRISAVINQLASTVQGLPGVGGFAGAIIGTLGGIVGGLFGASERRREQAALQRVRIDEYGDRALSQMEEQQSGPDRVILRVVDAQGRPLDNYRYELGRLERRDAVSRLPG